MQLPPFLPLVLNDNIRYRTSWQSEPFYYCNYGTILNSHDKYTPPLLPLGKKYFIFFKNPTYLEPSVCEQSSSVQFIAIARTQKSCLFSTLMYCIILLVVLVEVSTSFWDLLDHTQGRGAPMGKGWEDLQQCLGLGSWPRSREPLRTIKCICPEHICPLSLLKQTAENQ